MSIRLLRTLVAVSDSRTFSAAADQVHVTHAAVSQQMQTLESELGIKLFNRSKRTPELTPIAHEIVQKARQVIIDYDNLVSSVVDKDGLDGDVTFGALPTTLTGLTPRTMAVLRTRFPQLRLVTEPLELIASTTMQGSDPEQILKAQPFIRFNRNAVVGTLIDNWLVSKNIRVSEIMELDSLEAIESMVHANLGVSIVAKRSVQPSNVLPLKRVSLGRDAPSRCLGLAYRNDYTKVRVIEELFAALNSVIEENIAQT